MGAYELDKKRYNKEKPPKFLKYYRLLQGECNILKRNYIKLLFKIFKKINLIELSEKVKIGEGLYIGHPYMITINPNVIIGKNCNIHKGVTIGQENRGARKGTPTIGNDVWIGINATIVGNINIGNDVLIAPNTYVNKDIPSHSVVFGNPCQIKFRENATENYINNRI